MNRTIASKAALLAALAIPLIAQAGSISLVGDKDCFGTNGVCVEDGSTWLPGGWGSVVNVGDAYPTDTGMATGSLVSWTHTFAPGGYFGAMVTMRTAGFADIAGPYTLFADGASVGAFPIDGTGHILVETFSFSLTDAMVADGSVTFSFTPGSGDFWAFDYIEITADTGTVPVPGTLALAGLGLLGLGLRRRSGR